MDGAEHLRGLSGERSGVMTKRVNVFDQRMRQIRCIKKTHDYLGDGTLITEEELEEGKLYTYIEGSAESYGNSLKNCRQNTVTNHIFLRNWSRMMNPSCCTNRKNGCILYWKHQEKIYERGELCQWMRQLVR